MRAGGPVEAVLVSQETIRRVPKATSNAVANDLFLSKVFPAGDRTGCPPTFRVRDGLVVGREPDRRGLAIDDACASRRHFRLKAGADGWLLEDMGSANGTWVNGIGIKCVPIRPQMVVRAGDTIFVAVSEPPRDLEWLAAHDLVGCSHELGEVLDLARKTARDETNVLILGETGTGKDVTAALIHALSRRRGRLVAVNCAAIPDSLVEASLFGSVKGAFTGADQDRQGLILEAQLGTLLLDEIAELSNAVQVKLLRALEERSFIPVGGVTPVNFGVKILAATNNEQALKSGSHRFRQDLLARLEDQILVLPPLRHRKEEIVMLVDWVLDSNKETRGSSFSPDFIESMLLYHWPRNVRQLVKLVKRSLRSDLKIDSMSGKDFLALLSWDVPDEVPDADEPPGGEGATAPKTPKHPTPSAHELRAALVEHQGVISDVARHFGVHRKQVYRWLKAMGPQEQA